MVRLEATRTLLIDAPRMPGRELDSDAMKLKASRVTLQSTIPYFWIDQQKKIRPGSKRKRSDIMRRGSKTSVNGNLQVRAFISTGNAACSAMVLE
jgi:hypothetical protein